MQERDLEEQEQEDLYYQSNTILKILEKYCVMFLGNEKKKLSKMLTYTSPLFVGIKA